MKPPHLTPESANRFQQQSVVDRYHLRLPYPPETFETLAAIMPPYPNTVLDVGTGTGELARGLAPYVERVDAVDVSAAMLKRAQAESSHTNIQWIEGKFETVELAPPYGLITGGDSIHWMDWEVAFRRFKALLAPTCYLVTITRRELPPAWQTELTQLIRQFSLVQNYQPYRLPEELEKNRLFRLVGERITQPVKNCQTVDDYIESFHSRTSFAVEDMGAKAREFDQLLREIVLPYSKENQLELETVALISWGDVL